MLALIVLMEELPPHHQKVIMIDGGLKNPQINYPLETETISSFVLIISPVAALALLMIYRTLDCESPWYGVSAMLREFLWSTMLSQVLTAAAKNYVGRPRPNFFAFCGWQDGTGCTRNEEEAYKSFPSGHASFSMASFGLITIHFVENVLLQLRGYQVPLWRLDASRFGWLWNLFFPITKSVGPSTIIIALIPGFFAFFIACSRIHDYYHFADDTICGMVIGISSALLAFFMFKKNKLYPNSLGHEEERKPLLAGS